MTRRVSSLFTVLLVATGLLLAQLAPSGEASGSRKRFKVLHIMSYHAPWEWTDAQLAGFQSALQPLDVEYRVFQMDTKRRSAEEAKQAAGRQARDLIDSWKPDLVYTNDDDAQQYVVKHYVNRPLPFVFSGVNADPAVYGFTGSNNVTGVVEHEHFVESVALLKEVVPSVKRIAIVLDNSPMWGPVVARMRARLGQLPPGVEITRWDTPQTFAEYQQHMLALEREVDAVGLIGIFTFKDAQGRNVPYQDVLRWTAEHSRLPDFSFWKDRVSFGTLAAVSVSGYEQGREAGKLAYGILHEGRSPAAYPMKPSVKGEPLVSLARANALGLRVRSGVLLTANVMPAYIWEK